ncbi:hypothetical protein GGF32_004443 [Allomyces javanicus]|nr:hypothetical protein GGF32_004443 [Allomyces javanicus]
MAPTTTNLAPTKTTSAPQVRFLWLTRHHDILLNTLLDHCEELPASRLPKAPLKNKVLAQFQQQGLVVPSMEQLGDKIANLKAKWKHYATYANPPGRSGIQFDFKMGIVTMSKELWKIEEESGTTGRARVATCRGKP